MTELLLICAISALGVAFATTVARWVAQQPIGDEDLARASDTVNGGVVRYWRRQTVVAAAVAAVVGAAVFLVYGAAYQLKVLTVVAPREHGVWLTLTYLLGAALGIVSATVGAWMARLASARVAGMSRRSLDESLQVAMRAGAVSGVVAQALALLGLAGLFLAFYLYAGGVADPALALHRAPEAPLLLSGFALGAAFVALLTQIGGGIFGNVADIGADVAGKLEGALAANSAENPAAVADLVGDNVGDGAARVVSVFAVTSVELVASMLVASALYVQNENLPSVTAVVLYPLVARTFSLLAAWFGVMVVRTDDTEVPMNAVARGLHVTTLLYGVGTVGCAKWLLGVHWMRFGACAVLGLAAALVSLYVTQYYTEQKYRPVRMLAEAARGGASLATLRGLFTAIEGGAVHVTITVAAMVGAFYVGEQTELVGGGLFGVALAVGGMIGSAPYVLAMDGLGSVADIASGIIEMTVGTERPDVRARARLLDAVGTTTKSYTRTLVALSAAVSCLLLLSVFISRVWRGAEEQADQLDMTNPLLYVGAMLGALVVLIFVGVTLRRITISSRDLVNELRVQLGADDRGTGRGLKVTGGPFEAPADRALEEGGGGHRAGGGETRLHPSGVGTDNDGRGPQGAFAGRRPRESLGHLACVEIVSRVALRGMLAPAAVGVGVPLLIGVALRLLPTGDRVTSSAEALVALLIVATMAGAFGSLLFSNAGSAWDNAKKYIETGAHGGRFLVDTAKPTGSANPGEPSSRAGDVDNPTYVAAVIADTIGDPLKGAIGPAIPSLFITLVAFALVFLPFFL